MTDKKMTDMPNLVFKDEKQEPQDQQNHQDHAEVGPSSLYGRIGDNVTFHPQNPLADGSYGRMWSWAWKDLGKVFLSLARLFFPRK